MAADLARARMAIVDEWIKATGTPYRWGGKIPGTALDCSGLIEAGWRSAGVWPFAGDATADAIWRGGVRVEWAARLPGDVVAFGDRGTAHHVCGVVSLPTRAFEGQLIGANHGDRMQDGETAERYVARMTRAKAAVEITSDVYWIAHRLGVIRAPKLAQKVTD